MWRLFVYFPQQQRFLFTQAPSLSVLARGKSPREGCGRQMVTHTHPRFSLLFQTVQPLAAESEQACETQEAAS